MTDQPDDVTTDVMKMLREGTAELHRSAEHQEFQQRMFRAEIGREEYAAWLGQMRLVHAALERRLQPLAAGDGRYVQALADHAKEPLLAADLAALGIAEAVEPLPATAKLLDRIGAEDPADPLRLLGYHYVLEGSTNGNRILARRLLPALGLEAGEAGRYLDPYGGRQREAWARFKQEMTAIGFSAGESATLVDAACEMFAALGDVSSDLARLVPSSPLEAG